MSKLILKIFLLLGIGFFLISTFACNIETQKPSNSQNATIVGIATLEGFIDQTGISVELIGTSYNTITDKDGNYNFSVPSGIYPGGIMFSKENFSIESESETISLIKDSTYSVPTNVLKCLKSTIRGTVDIVDSEDNSKVKVSLVNMEGSVVVTKESGEYEFDKVSIGPYTLRYERENNPIVEKQIELKAGPQLVVDTIKLIKNSSSITGIATLKNLSDFSNIKVSVKTSGSNDIISTNTNSMGYFYIGNLVSKGFYEVSFEKDGWDTQTIDVSGLMSLEEKNITDSSTIALVDTTKPLLNSVTINSGSNKVSNKRVTLHFDAFDKGSGISTMQICFDNDFIGDVGSEEYQELFEKDLESGNGEKTVYVRLTDKAGNISDIKSANVTLIDQKIEVSGDLEDKDLYWTKVKSPYLVVGNVVVPEGKTLTIEQGVDIQFQGAFSITVQGFLDAVGTEEENINFYGIDDGVYKWEGIKSPNSTFTEIGTRFNPIFNSGNHLKYATLKNCRFGLNGEIFAENVSIQIEGNLEGEYDTYEHYEVARNLALESFTGVFRDGKIRGNIYNFPCVGYFRIIDSTIESRVIREIGFLIGNKIKAFGNNTYIGDNREESSIYSIGNFLARNNEISNFDKSYVVGSNNSFKNIDKLNLQNYCCSCYYCSNIYNNCNFEPIYDSSHNAKYIDSFSNFLNCGLIKVKIKSSYLPIYDLTNNFWGLDKTIDINRVGNYKNLDFFYDSYDDLTLSSIDYSNWSQEPYRFAGFLGENYIGFNLEGFYIKTKKPVFQFEEGNLIPINPIKFKILNDVISDKKIEKYRVVMDQELLQNSNNDNEFWISYPSDGIITYDFENRDYVTKDPITLFVQVKDTAGNISGIKKKHQSGVLNYGAIKDDNTIVFYDKGEMTDGWRYLAAAPAYMRLLNDSSENYIIPTVDILDEGYNDGKDDFYFGYYRDSKDSPNLYVNRNSSYSSEDCTRSGIGDGKRNTDLLVEAMKDETFLKKNGSEMINNYASRMVSLLEYNGITDWFLPSKDEAIELFDNYFLACYKNVNICTSSVDENDPDKNYYYFNYFSDVTIFDKDQSTKILPIREF